MADVRATLAVALLVLLSGCLSDRDSDRGEDDGEGGAGPPDLPAEPYTVNLAGIVPVALAPLPSGAVLVGNLLNGTVHLVQANGTLVARPVIDLPSVPFTGEKGLLGLAVHPGYPEEPWVYAFFTDEPPAAGPQTQRVVRFEFNETLASGGPPQDVVVGLPASPNCCHNGGRVAFDADGMLYVSIGDNMVQAEAQDPATMRGKILRYTDTGAVPDDNPTAGSPVAVTGLRNPFGLWLDDELGIVVTDNGPSTFDGPGGLDEVNVLQVGDNAGWPVSRGDVSLPGHVAPLWHSGEVHLGPTGVLVPRNSTKPEWDGKILWCNVNTNEALLLDPAAEDPEPTAVHGGCSFDVRQDALGRILFADNEALHVVF